MVSASFLPLLPRSRLLSFTPSRFPLSLMGNHQTLFSVSGTGFTKVLHLAEHHYGFKPHAEGETVLKVPVR